MEDINNKSEQDELNDDSLHDIHPTYDECREFGIHKRYGATINKSNKVITNKPKPTNGKLVVVNGKNESVVNGCYDLPFALLQSKRTELIRSGLYTSKQLKIKYL